MECSPWIALGSVLVSLLFACQADDGEGASCSSMADCRADLLCVSDGETGPGYCVGDESVDPGEVFADPVTALEWQVTPTAGNMDWESAVAHCRGLELEGRGWRLPTVGELRSLIRACPATETGGPCQIADRCLSFDRCETAECEGCGMDLGPDGGCYWPEALEGSCSLFYWSSSTIEENPERAFYVIFSWAHMSARTKAFFFGQARCVR